MQLVIDYPGLLPDVMQTTKSEFEQEARMAMAVKLFEIGRLSSGRASELAGMSRIEFLLNLSRYKVFPLAAELDDLETVSYTHLTLPTSDLV